MTTQKQMIKEWILEEPITSMAAFRELGVTRLAEYIRQLRVEGMNIKSVPQSHTNRFGKSVTYSKYVLQGQTQLF